MAAAARHSAQLQTELETAPSLARNNDSTPRPSISPLSAKASPVTMIDPAIHTSSVNERRPVPPGAGDDDDDRSSSLSEPEDDEEDEQLQMNGAKVSATTTEELSAHPILEVDSEAETERLDPSPDKLRKHADNAGRTPSKLSQAATLEDDLSDPPSPIPMEFGAGAASSTSTIETIGKDDQALTCQALVETDLAAGKKRKRSATADSSLTSAGSEIDESPRKRSQSSGADEATIAISTKIAANTVEDTSEPIEVDENPADAASPDIAVDAQDDVVATTKVVRGRKPGKQKSKTKKDIVKDVEPEETEAADPPVEEQSEEAAAKSAEELRHKQTASAVFEGLAKQFTSFREKMYNDRLAALNAELELLNQPDCTHPEYLRQVACVDGRHQKQINEIQAFYRFKLGSIRRTTLGERSQLHSQYVQHIRERREDVMYKLGEDWYNIQKERRHGHNETDNAHLFKYPTKKSVQIKQQANYNQEVSILSGVAKYVGFPAAPEISGTKIEIVEEDMKAMKITKHSQQTTANQQPLYIPNRSGLLQGQSDRIAHEQFQEQHPWARPVGQFHNHGTPFSTHTADWAEPGGSSKTLVRNLSGGIHVGGPYDTPLPQKRPAMEQSTATVHSDGVEQHSSILAAPPTLDRIQSSYLGRDQGSPLVVAKQRQNGGELTGFRNVSNISGASTIDAPPDSAEKERERGAHGYLKDASVPQHMFDASRPPRNGVEPKRQQDTFVGAPFRPQDGTYGTPVVP